jgi:hypothetical protein
LANLGLVDSNSFKIIHNILQSFISVKEEISIVLLLSTTKVEMMMKDNNGKREEVFILRPLNHKQLAQMYGVSWLTFQKWIKKVEKEVGKKTGHFYHVPQVRKNLQALRNTKAD